MPPCISRRQLAAASLALDRETGEVVWQANVSPAGFLGGMEEQALWPMGW